MGSASITMPTRFQATVVWPRRSPACRTCWRYDTEDFSARSRIRCRTASPVDFACAGMTRSGLRGGSYGLSSPVEPGAWVRTWVGASTCTSRKCALLLPCRSRVNGLTQLPRRINGVEPNRISTAEPETGRLEQLGTGRGLHRAGPLLLDPSLSTSVFHPSAITVGTTGEPTKPWIEYGPLQRQQRTLKPPTAVRPSEQQKTPFSAPLSTGCPPQVKSEVQPHCSPTTKEQVTAPCRRKYLQDQPVHLRIGMRRSTPPDLPESYTRENEKSQVRGLTQYR